MNLQKLQKKIEAARGKIPCDYLIKGARYLDVFSCQWVKGDIALFDGEIVGTGSGYKAKRMLSAKGLSIVPGFIDAHVHLESSMVVPSEFQKMVLPVGTTTAICDPHELANVQGLKGIEFFLKSALQLKLNLQVMASSCVPATSLETNGGGTLDARTLASLRGHSHILGLAEVMNVPGVVNGDPAVLEKILSFQGMPIDGHCPQLSGKDLSAYAAAGISSCHESTALSEAKEKLTQGIAIWIREGSVAKDLEALSDLVTAVRSIKVGFCTDDRNPKDIREQGHLDYMIRRAIQLGAEPAVAYRCASWTVANHYGLKNLGAIAPGYKADLVLLGDSRRCEVKEVFKDGISVSELDLDTKELYEVSSSVNATCPELSELEGPKGLVHVIGVKPRKILTDHFVLNSDSKGVAKLTVLERYGRRSPPSNGYVRGFGARLKGAIATSVAHDSHNLIVVGSDTVSMRTALKCLIECGGGFAVAFGDDVCAKLPLPLGGLMSVRPADEVYEQLVTLHKASHSIGCELEEPFLQLAFLSLPVIPKLKLTDRGLVDVERFEIIPVAATSSSTRPYSGPSGASGRKGKARSAS